MLCGGSQNVQYTILDVLPQPPTPYYVVAHRMDRFGHTILDVLPHPLSIECTDLDTQY